MKKESVGRIICWLLDEIEDILKRARREFRRMGDRGKTADWAEASKLVKLKYQMRGLGIGMVVTALLMGVATGKGLPLSDAEIRARAMELGMVDSSNLSLKDVQGTVEPTPIPTSKPAEVSGNDREAEDGKGEAEDSQGKAENPEGESQADAQASGDEERDEGDEGAPRQEDSSDEDVRGQDAGGDGTVTVVIESGTHSDEVSRRLAEAGLIEDAAQFDDYLCSNGYSVKIHAGTYQIRMGATEEEIIKIITKDRSE